MQDHQSSACLRQSITLEQRNELKQIPSLAKVLLHSSPLHNRQYVCGVGERREGRAGGRIIVPVY